MILIGKYIDIKSYRKLGYHPLSISNVRPIWYVEGSNEPLFAVPTEVMIDYDMKRISKSEYEKRYTEYLDTVADEVFLKYIQSDRVYVIICQYDEDTLQKQTFTNYLNKRFAQIFKELNDLL